jgi:hypothetical protein
VPHPGDEYIHQLGGIVAGLAQPVGPGHLRILCRAKLANGLYASRVVGNIKKLRSLQLRHPRPSRRSASQSTYFLNSEKGLDRASLGEIARAAPCKSLLA